jgi:hypothetical protein
MFLSGPLLYVSGEVSKKVANPVRINDRQRYQSIRGCQRRHSQASKAPGGMSLVFLTRNIVVGIKR